MRLIFLNRYCHPCHSATSQMLSDLAFALADRGYDVAVITSRQIYDAPTESLPAKETVSGVAIHRVRTTQFGRHNLIGRAVDYLTFYGSAAITLWRLARRGDVIVAKTDPPMLSVIAAPIARVRGAKLVNWLQDLFPEIAACTGLGRGPLARAFHGALRIIRNLSLHSAAMNVALGDRMVARLHANGIKPERARVIENWADGTVIRPVAHRDNAVRKAWGLQDKLVIGYSGNLGRAHEYDTILEAISRLERRRHITSPANPLKLSGDGLPDIVWLFIGGGALYDALARDAVRRGLNSILFKPYQTRDQLAQSLAAADVHLISLKPELEGLVVPSKFYGIAAAGRPAIFIGDKEGEIAQLLSRHQCGVAIAQGDGLGLAQTAEVFAANPVLCERLGKRARQAFETTFDKHRAVAQWEQLLRDVTGTAHPPVHAESVPESKSRVSIGNVS